MKRVVTVMFLAGVLAAGADVVKVNARKVTLQEREGKTQALPRGSTSYTAKDVGYEFTLTRLAPSLGEVATVEWMVMVEGMAGRLRVGTRGRQETALPLGQEAVVQTGPVRLEERSWQRGGNPGTIESSIVGYALRVLDAQGNVAYEEFKPASVKNDIDWNLSEQDDDPQPRRKRPRLQQP